MLQKVASAYNRGLPSRCGENGPAIAHLRRQIGVMRVKRTQILDKPTLTVVDHSEVEGLSASIARYKARIVDLEEEVEGECEEAWGREDREFD